MFEKFSHRVVSVLAVAASLTLLGPATAAGQVPKGCTVPPGHLIPGDPPDGFPNVGVIVAINGRYNAGLSTMPASAAVGAPLPLSVAREYRWGPKCLGHVRFVFFADPPSGELVKPSTGVSGDPIKSIPNGTGTVVLRDPIGGATHVAELGIAGIVPGFELDWPPGGRAVSPPPGTDWLPTHFVLEELDQPPDPNSNVFYAGWDADDGEAGNGGPPSGDDSGGALSDDAAAGSGAVSADSKPVVASTDKPSVNLFPHGAPPPCDWEEVQGTWHIMFRDGEGKPLAQSTGPLNLDDEDDRDLRLFSIERGLFEPGERSYSSSRFKEFVGIEAPELGVVEGFDNYGGTQWETVVVNVQYHCGGETWMVQYAGEHYLGRWAMGYVRSAYRM